MSRIHVSLTVLMVVMTASNVWVISTSAFPYTLTELISQRTLAIGIVIRILKLRKTRLKLVN